jgi:hypothetical protein
MCVFFNSIAQEVRLAMNGAHFCKKAPSWFVPQGERWRCVRFARRIVESMAAGSGLEWFEPVGKDCEWQVSG